jgi:hypothetical protein
MNARRIPRIAAIGLCAALFALLVPGVAFAGGMPAARPTIANPPNQLSRDGNVVVSGLTDSTVEQLRVLTPSMEVTVTLASGATTFSANVQVPVARDASTVRVIPWNSWSGYGPEATLRVYNLGNAPGYATFVLVDKYDFTLYLVTNGIVGFQRPVAIGMPGAQTPVRTFTLGKRQIMRPSRTSWGVMRLPLMKTVTRRVRVRVRSHGHWVRRWVRRKVLVKTSYYIHGTNDASSIGTMASHGCVRMYNADVTAFSTLAPYKTPVVIRN